MNINPKTEQPVWLCGKTIVTAMISRLQPDSDGREFDDEPYLFLSFSDGSEAVVTSSYGGYTGRSEDEYPAFISVYKVNK